MAVRAASTAAAVCAIGLWAGAPAPADSGNGVLDGVTASAPTCTADGSLVIKLSYPGGLPAGTTGTTQRNEFKLAPTPGATFDLGATSGTITYTAAQLSQVSPMSPSAAFALVTPDARIFQTAPVSTTLCNGGGSSAGSLPPAVAIGEPYCDGAQPKIPVTVSQAGSASREVKPGFWDNEAQVAGSVTASPGTTVRKDLPIEPNLPGGTEVTGSHTIAATIGGLEGFPVTRQVTIPDCGKATPPDITITAAGWDCATGSPKITYRNETGETAMLSVYSPDHQRVTTVTVPAGESTTPTAPFAAGGTWTFRGGQPPADIATITLADAGSCPTTSTPTDPATTTSPTTTGPTSPSPSTETTSTSTSTSPSSGTTAPSGTSTSGGSSAAGGGSWTSGSTSASHSSGAQAGGSSSASSSSGTGPVVETDHAFGGAKTGFFAGAGLLLSVLAGGVAVAWRRLR